MKTTTTHITPIPFFRTFHPWIDLKIEQDDEEDMPPIDVDQTAHQHVNYTAEFTKERAQFEMTRLPVDVSLYSDAKLQRDGRGYTDQVEHLDDEDEDDEKRLHGALQMPEITDTREYRCSLPTRYLKKARVVCTTCKFAVAPLDGRRLSISVLLIHEWKTVTPAAGCDEMAGSSEVLMLLEKHKHALGNELNCSNILPVLVKKGVFSSKDEELVTNDLIDRKEARESSCLTSASKGFISQMVGPLIPQCCERAPKIALYRLQSILQHQDFIKCPHNTNSLSEIRSKQRT
ncbi:hypothetical protein J6590_031205 [Homalodisca vitripennis]|nr:hypothetical protein J6590_031205 [Homalodisca vitripennis]